MSKAQNLKKLQQGGIRVPELITIPAEMWGERDPERAGYCWVKIAPECERMQTDPDSFAVRIAAAAARKAIVDREVPPAVSAMLRDWITTQPAGRLSIVRSSASTEDGARSSSAGQYDSIPVSNELDAMEKAYRAVMASYFGERAVAYREFRGLSQFGPRMDVIVQHFVTPRTAGIAFGCDPLSGDTDVMTIEASYGFGQAVVAGEVIPDRWVVKKADLAVVSSNVGAKRFEELVLPSGERQRLITNAERRANVSLSDAEIRELAATYLRIEALFNSAQDIEFCFAEDGLWVVQSRAVTAAGRKAA